MFTTWDQVKSWIEDNSFQHWIFYKSNPDERTDRANDIIIDSNNFVVSDYGDKLAMTEKYLKMYGSRVYGVGFKAPSAKVDGMYCEVRIEDTPTVQPTIAGLGGYSSIGELRESLTKEIRATIEAENYKREKAEFEKAKKEFEEEKKTAMGALVHYFAPIGQMMLQNKVAPMRQVAGVDAEQPVHVQPMIPDAAPAAQAAEAPEQEQSPFTDEEADKLFELMARFKKVEPQYMQLLEAVVTMAENGDSTYTMAKGFLIK